MAVIEVFAGMRSLYHRLNEQEAKRILPAWLSSFLTLVGVEVFRKSQIVGYDRLL